MLLVGGTWTTTMADVLFACFTFVQKRVGNCFKINPSFVWIFLCLNPKATGQQKVWIPRKQIVVQNMFSITANTLFFLARQRM